MEDPVARTAEFKNIEKLINPGVVETTKVLSGEVVDKNDQSVVVLESCQTMNRQRRQQEDEQRKLVERVDLDRPILQQEKIKLIMKEKTISLNLDTSRIFGVLSKKQSPHKSPTHSPEMGKSPLSTGHVLRTPIKLAVNEPTSPLNVVTNSEIRQVFAGAKDRIAKARAEQFSTP